MSVLTPTEDELVRLFEQTEADILRELNGAMTDAKRSRLIRARKQVRAALGQLRTGGADWSAKAMREAYEAGAKAADGMAKGALPALLTNPVHLEAIKALADAQAGRINGVADVVLSQASRQIADVQAEMLRQQLAGMKTTLEAARQVRKDLAERGITGFVDRAGKRWNMKTYAEMLARTSSEMATTSGTANRLVEHGIDLVTFTVHPNPCPICRRWQGRPLSLTGATPGYPSLEEAKADGMLHPNCRHAMVAYFAD